MDLRELFGRLAVQHGDLLNATQPLVMHQANNQGYMGKGIALAVRNDMDLSDFDKYKDFVRSNPLGGLGQFVTGSSLTHPERTYLHVIGQNGLGYGKQFTDYDALANAFQQIAEEYPGQDLAMPYGMGAGLGGGDWQTVEDLVNEYLAPYMNVYAYKLR